MIVLFSHSLKVCHSRCCWIEVVATELRRGSHLVIKQAILLLSIRVSRTNLRREGRLLEVYADDIKFSGLVVFISEIFFSIQVTFTTTIRMHKYNTLLNKISPNKQKFNVREGSRVNVESTGQLQCL